MQWMVVALAASLIAATSATQDTSYGKDDCAEYVPAAGGNGKERLLGEAYNLDMCISLAADFEPTANAVTLKNGNSRLGQMFPLCYSEIGQTDVINGESGAVGNCLFNWDLSSGKDKCVEYKDGDGNGQGQLLGVVASIEECIWMAAAYAPAANAVTITNPSGSTNPQRFLKCYSEVGQTGVSASSEYVNCLLWSTAGSDKCVELVSGDGNGDETYLGKAATFDECVTLAAAKAPTANAVTLSRPDKTGKRKCYSEVEQTGVSRSKEYTNCLTKAMNPSQGKDKCKSYSLGDGNGSEGHLGDVYNILECVELALRKKPDANAVTLTNPDNRIPGQRLSCYYEVGQSGTNGDKAWANCIL